MLIQGNINLIATTIPLITENYQVIHFDEVPILYCGTNEYGNKIFGSLINESDDELTYTYIHTVVNNDTFFNFVNRNIPYREVIQQGRDRFVVVKDVTLRNTHIYSAAQENIVEEYLPAPDYFCPQFSHAFGTDFILKLNGKLADMHFAVPKEISRLQFNFTKAINQILSIFNFIDFNSSVRLKPYAVGSFELRFNILFNHFSDLHIKPSEVHEGVASVLRSMIPVESIDEENIDAFFNESDGLKITERMLVDNGAEVTDKMRESIVNKFEKIVDTYAELSKNVGEGYDGIEILGEKRGVKEEFIPLSIINKDVSEDLFKINDFVESRDVLVEKDDLPKAYRISIRGLSKDSRKGDALIFTDHLEDSMDNPRITIMGSESLEKSIFTESLHFNKWIAVNARATKKNGVFRRLDIEYS